MKKKDKNIVVNIKTLGKDIEPNKEIFDLLKGFENSGSNVIVNIGSERLDINKLNA